MLDWIDRWLWINRVKSSVLARKKSEKSEVETIPPERLFYWIRVLLHHHSQDWPIKISWTAIDYYFFLTATAAAAVAALHFSIEYGRSHFNWLQGICCIRNSTKMKRVALTSDGMYCVTVYAVHRKMHSIRYHLQFVIILWSNGSRCTAN